MKRCVIIGGATISNYGKIKSYLQKDDFYICCDSGLNHVEKLEIKSDLIVGDFDSHENPNAAVETIVLPCEKDDTDTVFAVKEAVKRGFQEFLLIGVIGNRFDHSLGNIGILEFLKNKGCHGMILDDYSEMELVSQDPVFICDSFSYFSLLNISGIAKGISIKHAKYLLENGEITTDYQYGVSNEVLEGKVAEVKVAEGSLLLIRVFG